MSIPSELIGFALVIALVVLAVWLSRLGDGDGDLE